jgi:hypothetical protein
MSGLAFSYIYSLFTSDCLAKRDGPTRPSANSGSVSLRPRHTFFSTVASYSRRVWQVVASWRSCPSLVQDLGVDRPTVFQYWHAISWSSTAMPKGLHIAIILITWEIRKKRNVGIFNNKSFMPSVVLQRIKEESKN